MLTLFLLPDGIVETMMSYVKAIFTDGKLLIILALGIPLGFYLIKRVISIARISI